MPRRSVPGSGRQRYAVVVTLLVVLLGVALISLSPLALGIFHGATTQWERLSFIGQTYGAASAIISVLALVGVVLTLGYQARETKRAREETRRQAISDLLKMAMEDSDLDECWGPVPAPDDQKSRKQQLYSNMIIAAWEMSYETGATPEHRLRYNANEMFSGEVGRTFWRNSRESRLSTSANRHERRFHQILDEEYQRVVGAQQADTSGITPLTGDKRRARIKAQHVAWFAAGGVVTGIACWLRHRTGVSSNA
jgi:uncharacterized membrane protein